MIAFFDHRTCDNHSIAYQYLLAILWTHSAVLYCFSNDKTAKGFEPLLTYDNAHEHKSNETLFFGLHFG